MSDKKMDLQCINGLIWVRFQVSTSRPLPQCSQMVSCFRMVAFLQNRSFVTEPTELEKVCPSLLFPTAPLVLMNE